MAPSRQRSSGQRGFEQAAELKEALTKMMGPKPIGTAVAENGFDALEKYPRRAEAARRKEAA